MKKLFSILLGLVIVLTLSACRDSADEREILFFGVENVNQPIHHDFDPLDGVYAVAKDGEDLRDFISVEGEVNTETTGHYTLKYTLEPEESDPITKVRTVSVYPLADGSYDFRYINDDLRHEFFNTLETYHLTYFNDGIPLLKYWHKYYLVQDHIDLPLDAPKPMIHWGVQFSERSDEESTDITVSFRERISSFNPWEENDERLSEHYSFLHDTLYYKGISDGAFQLKPGLASGEPTIIDGETHMDGVETGTVFEIPIRDGLMWHYHEDTPVEKFGEGHDVLDAYTIEQSFRLALQEEWSHIQNFTEDHGNLTIKGAQDYANQYNRSQRYPSVSKPDWDDVGIYAKDSETLVFESDEPLSVKELKYYFSYSYIVPVNQHVFDWVKSEGSTYGDAPQHIAYSGAYRIYSYVENLVFRLEENENFYDADRFSYEEINVRRYHDDEAEIEAFDNETLDIAYLETYYVSNFEDSQNVYPVRNHNIGFLIPNGTRNEPILNDKDFNNALYYAINRESLASIFRHFSPSGSNYLSSVLPNPMQSLQSVYDHPSRRTITAEDAYDKDKAKAHFQKAINRAVLEGEYSKGDTITIDLMTYEGFHEHYASIIEDLEAVFTSERHDINTIITLTVTDEEAIHNNNFDLLQYTLNLGYVSIPNAFRDNFFDNNPFGKNLYINTTHDTNTPNILLTYTINGETREELWSYEALVHALNDGVELNNGEIISH